MYETFYGFTERPFQLTPDPAFYFESLTHKKALSYLGYGLNQGEGFIVITGEVGAGKSTLVAHLKEKLDDRRMTVGEVVTSALDGDEMVHVAARSFGLDVEGQDKAGTLAAIELFLHEEARAGRRALLIVDESQNLSIGALEELRMLSNFQLGAHPLLQTLLLGQPEFKQLIAQSDELEQLRQRIIAAHHLEPMQPGEIEPYVRHRLEHVGWDGDPELDRSLYVPLHKATGGIPRKINQIMTRLLLLGAVEERHALDSAMLESVLRELQSDPAAPATAEPGLAKPRPKRDNLPAAEAVAEARRRGSRDTGGGEGLAEAQLAAIERAFADRDRAMSELREDVARLREVPSPASAAGEDIAERLEAIEAQLDRQDRSLRQTMAALIEILEAGGRREAA